MKWLAPSFSQPPRLRGPVSWSLAPGILRRCSAVSLRVDLDVWPYSWYEWWWWGGGVVPASCCSQERRDHYHHSNSNASPSAVTRISEQRVGESGAAERAGLAWRAVAHSTVLSMSRGPAGLGRTRPLRIAWCGCQHRAEPWMGLSAHWKILFLKTVCVCSVVSNSLWPRGLYPPSLLCPWDSPARILEWVDIPPGDLPDPGIELKSLASFALAGRFFTTSATWTMLCLKA